MRSTSTSSSKGSNRPGSSVPPNVSFTRPPSPHPTAFATADSSTMGIRHFRSKSEFTSALRISLLSPEAPLAVASAASEKTVNPFVCRATSIEASTEIKSALNSSLCFHINRAIRRASSSAWLRSSSRTTRILVLSSGTSVNALPMFTPADNPVSEASIS